MLIVDKDALKLVIGIIVGGVLYVLSAIIGDFVELKEISSLFIKRK